MKSVNKELWVGVFVLLSMIALAFLAIKVSGLTSALSGTKTYSITANFENIGGLTTNAKVSISGVTIGTVKAIEYDTKMLNAKVTMEIDQQYNFIDTTATAAIQTAGLLGEKYIGITLGAGEKDENGKLITLTEGGNIYNTQSALVLEELIQKFVSNKSLQDPNAQASAGSSDESAEPAVADGF